MKRVRFAVLVAALAVAIPGCALGGGQLDTSNPVSTNHVNLPKSYQFDPSVIKVRPGETVTWTNNDNFTHTVRLLDTGQVLGTMPPGQSLSHVFSKPGTYRYDCSLHPNDMKGVVIVSG